MQIQLLAQSVSEQAQFNLVNTNTAQWQGTQFKEAELAA